MKGQSIRVTGVVQGVGFRPTVWRLAKECGVVGEVSNDSEGVLIHAWAESSQLDTLVQRLRSEAPPLARIEAILRTDLAADEEPAQEFRIVASREGIVRTGVAADAATCPDCLAEVMNPDDRRFRYPFTNCTHCGPRLSIVKAIPYDRENTSMASFPMCAKCQAEYEDPADRRFHAQPNACGDCGPQVWLQDRDGNRVTPKESSDSIAMAASLICEGSIVAIKGIGGFHLACDAGNEDAVARLRHRKKRYHKAFALMARDLEMVSRHADLCAPESALLGDSAAPIVVLPASGERFASGVAPGQITLGFMLPYSPLHHLLMADMPRPIVLTSGNRSDEPQSIDNTDAKERLDSIADYYLLHDRDIVNRLDDSVIRFAKGRPRFLRRSRGYAPRSMAMPEGIAGAGNVLAMGGELKNTFCLLQDDKAIVSQHIGDLEDAATYRDYLKNLELYRSLFEHRPDCIAMDMHPDYFSTRLGHERAIVEDLEIVEVQHHHAHIASCMAEHRIPVDSGPVLGVALDGLGFGDDGTLWGGEFLLADYRDYTRAGRFRPVPMPGGTQSIIEPWRSAWAHLDAAYGWHVASERYGELEFFRYMQSKPVNNLKQMTEKQLNSPLASSCGRLFDAVAAVLGLSRDEVFHEGQAAIELESLATAAFENEQNNAYPHERDTGNVVTLLWQPMWESLLADVERNVATATVAARFHHGLVRAVAQMSVDLCERHAVDTVVLNGGVFQNRLLLEATEAALGESGLRVLSPEMLPANDGGIAFGQAVVAAARLAASENKA